MTLEEVDVSYAMTLFNNNSKLLEQMFPSISSVVL